MSARAERLTRLRQSLAASGLDALLVSALPNIRYLTGFSGSNALVVVTPSACLLLTDFRYATQVKHEVAEGVRTIIESASLWGRLWTELQSLPGTKVLAFETAHVTHQDAARFLDAASDGSRWLWRPAVNLVEVLRESKDEDEIGRIREAVRIAESALAATLPQVHAGMTELEVAGRLEHELRSAGSEGFPFETIIASGARSALPMPARPGRRSRAATCCSSTSARSTRATAATSRGRSWWVRLRRRDRSRSTWRFGKPTGALRHSFGRECVAGMPTRSRGTTLTALDSGPHSGTRWGTGSGWRSTRRPGWRRVRSPRCRRVRS